MEDKFKSDQGCPSLSRKKLGCTDHFFVPPDATIAELEKRAAECEQKAAEAEEPLAAKLRGEAKLCREWVAAVRSGRWTS